MTASRVGGGGTVRPGFLVRLGAALLALVVIGACGGDGTSSLPPEQRDALVERLQETDSLSSEEAECVVDDAGEELGGDRLQEVVDLFTGAATDAEVEDIVAAEDDLEVVREAYESCGIELELEE